MAEAKTAVYSRNLTLDRTYSGPNNIPYDASVPWAVLLPAALSYTLTTRTDNDTGVLTVASGHGMANPDKVDVYWVDSTTGLLMKRVGMTVTANTSTTVSVDGGSGDNLPLVNSTGTVQEQVALTIPVVDGDTIVAIGFDPTSGGGGSLTVVDDGPGTTVLTTSGTAPVYIWDGTGTNPLAGKTVTAVRVTQAGLSSVTVYGAFAVNT